MSSKYVLSTSEIDTSPEETLKGYYSLCTWFSWYLVLLWITALGFIIYALINGRDEEDETYWSKLTKEENRDFYYASIVFAVLVGIFLIFTVIRKISIAQDRNDPDGVLSASFDVVRDVSAMYQNKASSGLMHRGIASLFSKRKSTISSLENHFAESKVGKIFQEF